MALSANPLLSLPAKNQRASVVKLSRFIIVASSHAAVCDSDAVGFDAVSSRDAIMVAGFLSAAD